MFPIVLQRGRCFADTERMVQLPEGTLAAYEVRIRTKIEDTGRQNRRILTQGAAAPWSPYGRGAEPRPHIQPRLIDTEGPL
jgi:hypothetical protein